MRGSFFVCTCLFLSVFLHAEQDDKSQKTCLYGPECMRAAVRHIEAGGIGYTKGYTTFEAFIAQDPFQQPLIFFLDLRGHVFNDGKFAANAGAGIRKLATSRIYGINFYYDYRQGHHKGYSQVALGLETLGSLWDLRVNGYLPIGEKHSDPYHIEFAGFSGNSILVRRKFEYSMKGIDGEMGFHFGKTKDFDFEAAIGPYYFKGPFGKGAIGGKARGAIYYKDYITAELIDSFDNVFHNNFQGQLTFSFPFGPKSTSVSKTHYSGSCETQAMLENRMVWRIDRQEIIVLNTDRKKEAASNTVLFVNNLSHSNGTFENPYSTLADAQANSQPGDIIYVFPGDGTSAGMSDGITLLANQKLWGSGIAHRLTTNLGTILIPSYTITNPTITNMGMINGGHAVLLGANNELSGLILSNTDPGMMNTSVIYGESPGNVSLLSSTISLYGTTAFSGSEVYFKGTENGSFFADNLTIVANHNIISGTIQEGLYIETDDFSSASVTISDSVFSGLAQPISLLSINQSYMNSNVSNNLMIANTDEFFVYSDSSVRQDYYFTQNTIEGTTSNQSLHLQMDSSSIGSNLVLKGNNFNNNKNMVFLEYKAPSGVSSLLVENNQFNASSNIPAHDGLFIRNEASGSTSALVGAIYNNTFLNNQGGAGLHIAQTNGGSTLCFDIVGNVATGNSIDYRLNNTGVSGSFQVSPCNAASLNSSGLFANTSGFITHIDSCSSATVCP